jgi:ectoine hydroxylase-related dioxygenase (phytanoyl-CoA dioxygenase family)
MSNTNHHDRYPVKVEDYIAYQRDGYLVVRNLVSAEMVEALKNLANDFYEGRITVPGTAAANGPEGFSFTRVHMIHRSFALGEQAMLYPRLLDVLEALIGPDVLALQTMLFLNPPGKGGQGWHQDAYYIPTYPNTLIGASLSLDATDEENGCLWVAPGSHCEPIYPTSERPAYVHNEDTFEDLELVENVSNLDDEVNTLSRVARKYPPAVPVPTQPGDVIFFHSHLLHRSHVNRSNRFRRTHVCHYCSARSWVPWNHGFSYEGDAANYLHILARGWTHLPFAQPRFGTPCAALAPLPDEAKSMRVSRMMGMEGDMVTVIEEKRFEAPKM